MSWNVLRGLGGYRGVGRTLLLCIVDCVGCVGGEDDALLVDATRSGGLVFRGVFDAYLDHEKRSIGFIK